MIVWCGNKGEHRAHLDCPGWPQPDVVPSDEQWLARVRASDDAEALERVHHLRTEAQRGRDCFIRNHEGNIEALRQQVAEMQVRIDDLSSAAEFTDSESLNS